jgi:hypothetical protein
METSGPGRVKRRGESPCLSCGRENVWTQKTPGLRPGVKGAAGLAYLPALLLRRNFVVNFSTRPAVSTMRFSPV